MERLPYPKGDRVKIAMSGKFLPFKTNGATGNAQQYGYKEEGLSLSATPGLSAGEQLSQCHAPSSFRACESLRRLSGFLRAVEIVKYCSILSALPKLDCLEDVD